MSDHKEEGQLVTDDSRYQYEEDEIHPTGNPTAPPDVDLEMLRGDRIGDTIYSGKWCIETVMKLMQSNAVIKEDDPEEEASKSEENVEVVDMDEDLQNQVGVLWDMTGNEEVCDYLFSVGAIESICHVIANSRCPRATEMCVGMLANVFTHKDMWKTLRNDVTIYNTVIPLLANTDQPSLFEVMRFFNTALSHKENAGCFNCLCDWEELVVQELIRILSCSTNGELLKQTTELLYNLMILDTDEQNFCASLASTDFLQALLEASREIGYEHVTSGQNHVMDVLYHLTTYNAGAMAMEKYLEEVACAVITYLKSLCHNLSLSNDSITLTTLIATLDHVYCRHTGVQIDIFSSPRVIRYIIKVLVTVYRRLGVYHSISHSHPRYNLDERKAESSSWTEPEDTPTKRTNNDGSWSDRATAAMNTTLGTPEASPMTSGGNVLDVSWSERRMGTPLADQFVEEVWKRPKGTKRVYKKKEAQYKGEIDSDISLERELPLAANSPNHDASSNTLRVSELDSEKESKENSSSSPEEKSTTFNNGAIKINGKGDAQNMSFETFESIKRLGITSNESLEDNANESICENQLETSKCKFDSDDDEIHGEDEINHKGDDFDDNLANGTQREDKYQSLLNVISEFFTDLLNTLSKSAIEDVNSPGRELISYLDRKCSSIEIKAVVRCVGPSLDIDQPVGKFVQACETVEAKHLESVLKTFFKDFTSGSD